MKKISTNDLLMVAAAGAVAGVLIYLARRLQNHQMLKEIAEEGYETAHEVLFPDKKQIGQKLHYGPVLPEDYIN
ncbi:MAG: hypothetical protein J0H29_20535 [Sphingobacteriales bacterium]|nr:hypothetical protein [Sphingobacteriales bacterium]OJY88420.1 MAG: hypothetical protein BGP14_13390 [Sphingobacteriales bacterium 44-15]